MKIFGKASRCAAIIIIIAGITACSDDESATTMADAGNGPPQAAGEASTPAATADAALKADLPTPQEPDAATAGDVEEAPVTEPAAATDTPTADAQMQPQQHIVKGVVTQWSPMVLFVQPGDQIVFKQMVGHDAETIDGMIPEGAATWKSKLGQEGFAVTLDVPGVYVYKCNPHVSLGMIGAIVVGDTPPANLQQLEDHPQNKGMIGRAVRKLKQALEAHAGS